MNNNNFNSKRRKFNQIVFVSFLSITFLHFSKNENIIIDQKKIRKNSKLKWILNSEDI